LQWVREWVDVAMRRLGLTITITIAMILYWEFEQLLCRTEIRLRDYSLAAAQLAAFDKDVQQCRYWQDVGCLKHFLSSLDHAPVGGNVSDSRMSNAKDRLEQLELQLASGGAPLAPQVACNLSAPVELANTTSTNLLEIPNNGPLSETRNEGTNDTNVPLTPLPIFSPKVLGFDERICDSWTSTLDSGKIEAEIMSPARSVHASPEDLKGDIVELAQRMKGVALEYGEQIRMDNRKLLETATVQQRHLDATKDAKLHAKNLKGMKQMSFLFSMFLFVVGCLIVIAIIPFIIWTIPIA